MFFILCYHVLIILIEDLQLFKKTDQPGSAGGGIFRYANDMYAQPFSAEQINVLKKIRKGMVIDEAEVSRYFINKAIGGGRLPHSVHKKLLQYIEKIES